MGVRVVRRFVAPALALLSLSAFGAGPPNQTLDNLKEVKQLEEQAKRMGPWENEAGTITEAYTNIFAKNGWDSEPDRFSLDLINQVSRIDPWHPAQREEVFFNGLQVRYGLTPDQRSLVSREMRTESMTVTMKHLTEIMPVALEIAQTRAQQKPFTAEQVQKWSKQFGPIMDDALAAVQRVEQKLRKTMTPQQREILDVDMKAVLKRHHAIEKMVKDWQAGKWNPGDWGLENDPIHAAAMAAYHQKQAERTQLVEAALLKKKPDLNAISSDESAWERYVKWFCNYYKCDQRQRGMAATILKSSQKQAADYLSARRRDIEKARRLSESAQSEAGRKYHAAELKRLRKPISDIFNSLCARLEKQVLTRQQQQMIDAEKTKKARQQADKDIAAKK